MIWFPLILAGAAAGVALWLSPVTVAFIAFAPLLLALATRGLSKREARWVGAILCVAVLLRAAIVATVFLLTDHDAVQFGSFFGDELHTKINSLWLRNMALDVPIAATQRFAALDPYGRSGYIYAMAWLQLFTGPAPYGIQLVNIAAFLIGAVVLYRTLHGEYGAWPAFLSLCVLLFMPSLFLWSVSALKEPAYFLVNATMFGACVRIVRARGRSRAVLLLLLAASVCAIAVLRAGVIAIAAATLGGWLVGLIAERWSRILLVGAGAAVLATAVLFPRVNDRALGELRKVARYHWGHVATPGHGYKLLDERFYVDNGAAIPTMNWPEAVRFLARASGSFIFVPLPWQMASTSELALLPQQCLWYVLCPLALVGVAAGWRRSPLLTGTLAANMLAGALLVGLTNGNVGTLVRMRDMVTPAVVCLGVIGACWLAEQMTTRDREPRVEWARHAEVSR